MDHLPAYYYRIQPYPTVPYLCTEEYDPAEGFRSYPTNSGWSLEKLLQGDVVQGQDKKAAASFLQNWLFFGLLAKLNAFAGQPFVVSDFVSTDGNRKTVTTAKLEKLIKRWTNRLKSVKLEKRSTHLQKISYILETMSSMSRRLYHLHLERHKACPLPLRVITSIKVLGCTIEYTLSDLEFDTLSHDWQLATHAERRMRAHHWCPRDVALVSTFLSPLQRYCATFIKRGPGVNDQDHSRCNEITCFANQIDERSYETRHRCPEGNCAFWEPDMEKMEHIVRDHGFPFVEMKPEDNDPNDLTLVTGKRRKRGQFPERVVVVSHVWSDGLGNPHRNAIPHCQLRFLYDLLRSAPWHQVGWDASVEKREGLEGKSMQSKTNVSDPDRKARFREALGQSVRIWLDTLCVPLSPTVRKIAITDMRKIYSTGIMILVLDAELLQIDHKLCSEGEILLRIALSGWMRRCWTYQEAIIGGGVLRICFKHGFYDLPNVVGHIRQRNTVAQNYLDGTSKVAAAAYTGIVGMIKIGTTVHRVRKNLRTNLHGLADADEGQKGYSKVKRERMDHSADGVYTRFRRHQAEESEQQPPLPLSDSLVNEVKIFFATMTALWSPQPSSDSEEYMQDRATRIAAAWRGLQYRSTSRQDDRFINFAFACAKSKEDFDALEQMLKHPAAERFQAWLAGQPVVPSGLLFARGRKMSSPGYRWSPCDIWPTDLHSIEPAQIRWKHRGSARSLVVHRPGFLLQMIGEVADSFHVSQVGTRSQLAVTIDRETVPETNTTADSIVFEGAIGLVLEDSALKNGESAGALLADISKTRDTYSGNFVCRVEVTKIDSTATTKDPEATGIELSDSQAWEIS